MRKDEVGCGERSRPCWGVGVREVSFRGLDKAGAKLIPNEGVKGLGNLTELISLVKAIEILLQTIELKKEVVGKRGAGMA